MAHNRWVARLLAKDHARKLGLPCLRGHFYGLRVDMTLPRGRVITHVRCCRGQPARVVQHADYVAVEADWVFLGIDWAAGPDGLSIGVGAGDRVQVIDCKTAPAVGQAMREPRWRQYAVSAPVDVHQYVRKQMMIGVSMSATVGHRVVEEEEVSDV